MALSNGVNGLNGHCTNGHFSENDKVNIFVGNILHCQSKGNLEVLENGFVVVVHKKIAAIGNSQDLETTLSSLKINQKFQNISKTQLKNSQILIPGLVDTHIHAPQYPNAGLGYDKTLLQWLDSYTFKLERQYKDLKFAKKVYDAIVKKTLDHGTTTACYYGSLFVDSTLALVDSCIGFGQRALVGKVNMTKSSCDDYLESSEENVKKTVQFVEEVLAKDSDPNWTLLIGNPIFRGVRNKLTYVTSPNFVKKLMPKTAHRYLELLTRYRCDLVKPVITPRFVLSLDFSDMKDLGQIANKYGLHIQTHISENRDEVKIVNEIYKNMQYSDIYDNASLLTPKTVLAHGIYLEEEELKLIRDRGTSVSHCPDSNTCLKSGLCDVRRLWEFGVKVGLGTDVSGGPLPSIIRTMKSALDVSVHLSFQKNNYTPLNYKDVFYLATLGGAEALAMEDKIGNFKVGKDFDALLVDLDVQNDGNIDHLISCEPLELLQKFIYCGDDRNVKKVYVAGKCVKNKEK